MKWGVRKVRIGIKYGFNLDVLDRMRIPEVLKERIMETDFPDVKILRHRSLTYLRSELLRKIQRKNQKYYLCIVLLLLKVVYMA